MATKPWIFVLDADERLTPESIPLLRAIGESEPRDVAHFVRITSTQVDGPITHHLPRLFPTSPRIRYRNAIHETLVLDDIPLVGPISEIRLIHLGYGPGSTQAKALRNLPIVRKEVKRRPGDPFAWYNLGFLLTQLGGELLDEGLEAFETMLDFGCSSPFVAVGASILANMYLTHKEDVPAAFQALDVAERLCRPDGQVLFTRGRALTMIARYDEARRVWTDLLARELELRPGALIADDGIFTWKTRFNIAITYVIEGRFEDSLRWFNTALKYNPESIDIMRHYLAAFEALREHNLVVPQTSRHLGAGIFEVPNMTLVGE